MIAQVIVPTFTTREILKKIGGSQEPMRGSLKKNLKVGGHWFQYQSDSKALKVPKGQKFLGDLFLATPVLTSLVWLLTILVKFLITIIFRGFGSWPPWTDSWHPWTAKFYKNSKNRTKTQFFKKKFSQYFFTSKIRILGNNNLTCIF